MPRNAELTRRRILDAAVGEFAARGYSGARVDRIAATAGANKRMIYHHFGHKLGLFEAALSDQAPAVDITGEVVRLWMHEALERGDENILRLAEREQAAAAQAEAVLQVAEVGSEAPAELDAGVLALSRIALDVFPLAFPQIVRVVTGRRAASEEFRAAWKRLLRDRERQPRVPKPRLRIDRERMALAALPRSKAPSRRV